MTARRHLFREANDEEEVEVTYIELFFDLVFVFAITQLSHHLVEHLSWHGAIETLILFLAIWWVWIYTSWTTNWMDPERGSVRLMLIAMMLGGLLLATSLAKSFTTSAALFVGAYLTMQIGRTLFMVWASLGVNEARKRNFLRIAFWFLLSAPLWIAGVLTEGDTRLMLWAGALAIEYTGPFLFFRTPGLGQSRATDWDISGAHMAERCALFIIIALGESVLVTGSLYAGVAQDRAATIAFAVSFLVSAAMWWVYFDIGAKRGSQMIEESGDTGRIARNAYTYLHMIIVAGLILTAVGDAIMIEHPLGSSDLGFILTACGGPWLFLLGNLLFKWESSGFRFPPLSHGVGMTLLIAFGASGYLASWQPLTIGILVLVALIATAGWEWFSLHGGWQRWAPWAGPLFSRSRGP